jgi:hypothetical protein
MGELVLKAKRAGVKIRKKFQKGQQLFFWFEPPFNVRFWGKSGHHSDMRSCLLLTPSGHAYRPDERLFLRMANLSRVTQFNPARRIRLAVTENIHGDQKI